MGDHAAPVLHDAPVGRAADADGPLGRSSALLAGLPGGPAGGLPVANGGQASGGVSPLDDGRRPALVSRALPQGCVEVPPAGTGRPMAAQPHDRSTDAAAVVRAATSSTPAQRERP